MNHLHFAVKRNTPPLCSHCFLPLSWCMDEVFEEHNREIQYTGICKQGQHPRSWKLRLQAANASVGLIAHFYFLMPGGGFGQINLPLLYGAIAETHRQRVLSEFPHTDADLIGSAAADADIAADLPNRQAATFGRLQPDVRGQRWGRGWGKDMGSRPRYFEHKGVAS